MLVLWHTRTGLSPLLTGFAFYRALFFKTELLWLAWATHFLMWASSLVAVFRICGFVLLFPILNVTHDGHHFLLRILYYSLRGGVGRNNVHTGLFGSLLCVEGTCLLLCLTNSYTRMEEFASICCLLIEPQKENPEVVALEQRALEQRRLKRP